MARASARRPRKVPRANVAIYMSIPIAAIGAERGGAVIVKKKVTSPKKGGRRREPGLFRPPSHSPPESPGQRDSWGPWRVVRRPPCSRTRLCVRLAGALRAVSAQARRRSEDLAPAASTTRVRAQRHSAGPSVDGAGRACTVPVVRCAHARPVRAARAACSSPPAAPPCGRRVAQARRSNGRGAQGPREATVRWHFFCC